MVTFKDVHSAEMKATYKGLPQATRDQYEAQALVEKNDFAMCRQSAKVGRQATDSAIRREAAAAEAIVAEAIKAPFGGEVVLHEDSVRIGRGSVALSTLLQPLPRSRASYRTPRSSAARPRASDVLATKAGDDGCIGWRRG